MGACKDVQEGKISLCHGEVGEGEGVKRKFSDDIKLRRKWAGSR